MKSSAHMPLASRYLRIIQMRCLGSNIFAYLYVFCGVFFVFRSDISLFYQVIIVSLVLGLFHQFNFIAEYLGGVRAYTTIQTEVLTKVFLRAALEALSETNKNNLDNKIRASEKTKSNSDFENQHRPYYTEHFEDENESLGNQTIWDSFGEKLDKILIESKNNETEIMKGWEFLPYYVRPELGRGMHYHFIGHIWTFVIVDIALISAAWCAAQYFN